MDGWKAVLVSAGCVGAIACMGGNLSSKGVEGGVPIVWMENYRQIPICRCLLSGWELIGRCLLSGWKLICWCLLYELILSGWNPICRCMLSGFLLSGLILSGWNNTARQRPAKNGCWWKSAPTRKRGWIAMTGRRRAAWAHSAFRIIERSVYYTP